MVALEIGGKGRKVLVEPQKLSSQEIRRLAVQTHLLFSLVTIGRNA